MNRQTSVSKQSASPTAVPQSALVPRVEVFEAADGITLRADLPGVNKDGLKVQIEQDTLTIEGDAKFTLPENLQPLHAEVRSQRFQRSFTLSKELDAHQITASLQHGVLELHIPKRAEVRPRRIEVKAD
jgi:HSP20 family protein